MGKIAIEFQNISKQYALGSIGAGTLSCDLNRWWARIRGKEDPYLRIGEENDRSKKATGDFVWALKDINFHVEEGLSRCSDTFNANQNVFGKVYFPRLVVPLSIVISCMIKMGIQFGLFVLIYIYYLCNGYSLMVNGYAWLAPLLLLMLAGLGLGFGLLISSLTTKYRDLRFLITFGVQLWMYATPVIYPLSVMRQSHEQYMWIIVANPLTSIIETFKFGFLGVGTFSWFHLGYTLVFTVVIMLWGMVTFNRVQRSFMDVI